jgi:hypothetical protein
MYTQTAYRCSYCKKYGLSKNWIQKHEARCFYNPVSRSCSTCANFNVSDDRPSVFAMCDVKCLENIKFEVKEEESNKVNLLTNCASWVERPEDEEELAIYQVGKMGRGPVKTIHHDFTVPNDEYPF